MSLTATARIPRTGADPLACRTVDDLAVCAHPWTFPSPILRDPAYGLDAYTRLVGYTASATSSRRRALRA
jgi:hypothetical protein